VIVSSMPPLVSRSRRVLRTAGVGGYLPLAPGVSTVRYPIPQRTFKYVATVQSLTDETCHKPTFTRTTRYRCCRPFMRAGSGHHRPWSRKSRTRSLPGDRGRRLPALDTLHPDDDRRAGQGLSLQSILTDQGVAVGRLSADRGRDDGAQPLARQLPLPCRLIDRLWRYGNVERSHGDDGFAKRRLICDCPDYCGERNVVAHGFPRLSRQHGLSTSVRIACVNSAAEYSSRTGVISAVV
jgi:hypothetical protein